MGIKFEFLKAGNGDSILVSIDNYKTNILIDGGEKGTYATKGGLKDKIEYNIKGNDKKLDLVVMTHYDGDHIGGLIKLLEEEEKNIKKGQETIIKELWFNTFDNVLIETAMINSKTAAKDQIQFDIYLKKILSKITTYKPKVSVDEIKESIYIGADKKIELILLSPNDKKLDLLYKEDFEKYLDDKEISKDDYRYSVDELQGLKSAEDGSHRNGSSIAFILIYDNMKFLFLGDAHIGLIVDSLKEVDKKYYNKDGLLEFEFVKLSHHGSCENINKEFLDLILTDKYIILTSGKKFSHPHKKTISIIASNDRRKKLSNNEYQDKIEFLCNYEHNGRVFSVEEQKKYKTPFKLLSKLKNNKIKSSFYKELEYGLY